MITTLLLPGLNNSGPQHWQSMWGATDRSCERLSQAEWDAPRCADWVATLDARVARTSTPLVLVAHSSACALVAHWCTSAAPDRLSRVKGALLVAPSDPEGPHYPPEPTGFAPVPNERLPFPSIVVASTNDPYVSLDVARGYAEAWGSRFVNIGAAGHINSASGLGEWPAGYALLEELRGRPLQPPQRGA